MHAEKLSRLNISKSEKAFQSTIPANCDNNCSHVPGKNGQQHLTDYYSKNDQPIYVYNKKKIQEATIEIIIFWHQENETSKWFSG